MADTDRIGLAEMLRDLRAEIGTALSEGAGERIRFELGPVEVEATVSAERDRSGSGKVRFWLVEVGGDRRTHHTHAQRINLTLHPRLATAEGNLTSLSIVDSETPRER
ncbi:trypco2 family protein [Streptomyces atacamensis]|uniref:trypco2 family protein n=1 Tax=Streptomyces atacamensis TaxID=531966 RepID=UPI00399CB993